MTLGFIFLLVVLSGLLSASEIALTSLNEAKILAIKEDGKFGSRAIYQLKKTPQRVLVSILVSNQTVNVIATFLATMWALRTLDGGVDWFIVAFTLVLIIFGSILPKTFALGLSEQFARLIAYPLLFLVHILSPIIFLFELIINGFSNLFKIKPDRFSQMSENEMEAMIEIGKKEGILEEEQDKFLKHVLRLSETKVEEVMIPLKNIAAIDINVSRDELNVFLEENKFAEFPVFLDDINTIKGSVTLYDILQVLKHSTKKYPLKGKHLTQVTVIPKTATLIQLFKLLSEKKKKIGIVIDEFGQTIGLITLADMMKEITGISTKKNGPQPMLKKIGKNLWEADGDIRVGQVNAELGIQLPYPEHHLLSLVVLEFLERFPENEEVIIFDGVEIKIKNIEKNVVKKVELYKKRTK